MTYEECGELLDAYTSALRLADSIEPQDSGNHEEARRLCDYLGEHIASLLYTSCIGDGYPLLAKGYDA